MNKCVGRAAVARRSHKPEVEGSIPSPATTFRPRAAIATRFPVSAAVNGRSKSKCPVEGLGRSEDRSETRHALPGASRSMNSNPCDRINGLAWPRALSGRPFPGVSSLNCRGCGPGFFGG